MRFKALRHQPSDAARKSGYDNEGQLPDTLPDSRSRPEAVIPLVFRLLTTSCNLDFLGSLKNISCDCSLSKLQIDSFL